MDIFFIGVGDACDPDYGNTSIHVVADNQVSILFDCGFSVPHTYFAFCDDPDQLDLVWISHFHGDHYFGLPLLLLRFWEMGRSKPLLLTGQTGIADKVYAAMDLAFPGFLKKLCYDVQFREIEPSEPQDIAGITFQAVETIHSERNLGILVTDGHKRLYYSGDGRPSDSVVEMVRDCDFVVHEAFTLNDEFPYHGSIAGCLELAKKSGIKNLALVHLDWSFRKEQASAIAEIIDKNPSVTLPVKRTLITV